MGYALLSSSLLVLLPVCVVGGLLVGPAISCLMDALFRSYRDAPRGWWENYCKGMKQNWKSSLLPGIVFCLALGIELFFGMVLFSAEQLPGIGTLAVFFVGLLLLLMLVHRHFGRKSSCLRKATCTDCKTPSCSA